jgi:hypothetical protein
MQPITKSEHLFCYKFNKRIFRIERNRNSFEKILCMHSKYSNYYFKFVKLYQKKQVL